MLEAAYPHADGVEGRRGYPEGLPQLVSAGQREVIAQSPQHDAGELYRDAVEHEDPHGGAEYPKQTEPTAHRHSRIDTTLFHGPLLSSLLSGPQEHARQVERGDRHRECAQHHRGHPKDLSGPIARPCREPVANRSQRDPGISAGTPSRKIPRRAKASLIALRTYPTTPAPVPSRHTYATPLHRRPPRLAHLPDQQRKAHEGYQDAGEVYAKEPHERRAPHSGKRVPQGVQDHRRRERPPTLQLNVACPTLSLSRHSTAHTSPVQAACPAGDISPRSRSTPSSTPKLPFESSSEVNP